VYDSHTGSLVKTLRVRGRSPQNVEVQANLAVYTVARELHVVHLMTIEFAEIEAPGVVYAGNVRRGTRLLGALTYVPFAHAPAVVS
jgi:hypothetical protein